MERKIVHSNFLDNKYIKKKLAHLIRLRWKILNKKFYWLDKLPLIQQHIYSYIHTHTHTHTEAIDIITDTQLKRSSHHII